MATWTLTGQGTDGATNQTFTVGTGNDRIWFTGATYATKVNVSSAQTLTHRSNSSDVEQCSSVHLHNIEYVDSTHFKLDAGASTLLSATVPSTANCPFNWNFADAASVATSGVTFYAYDGSTDATAMAGVNFYAFERSNTTWTTANGSGAALTIADQGASTSHDFFIACSVVPTSVGTKTGSVKMTGTYA